MRLIMLGTGPFAVPTLERSPPAAMKSRSSSPARPQAATRRRARFSGRANARPRSLVPDTVNSPEAQSRLASLAPDLLVVCDYGEILRPETLATARLGGINLHGSLLPKYRGAAPSNGPSSAAKPKPATASSK